MQLLYRSAKGILAKNLKECFLPTL